MVRIITSFAAVALLAMPLVSHAQAPAKDAGIEKVYLKSCKNCHGVDGKAQTKMGKKHEIDSFTDAAWQSRHSDDEIREAITNGVKDTKMKAYGTKLSAEQISALVQYVRAFGGGASAQAPEKAAAPAPK